MSQMTGTPSDTAAAPPPAAGGDGTPSVTGNGSVTSTRQAVFTVPSLTLGQGADVAGRLQQRLVAPLDLGLTLKHIHWNVVGPNFIGVHEMLDPQYAGVQGMIDEIAERIATLGATPSGLPGRLVAERSWDDYALDRADAIAHLGALDLVYQGVIADHRAQIAAWTTSTPSPRTCSSARRPCSRSTTGCLLAPRELGGRDDQRRRGVGDRRRTGRGREVAPADRVAHRPPRAGPIMAWRPFGRRRRGLLRRMWWMGLASTPWANRREHEAMGQLREARREWTRASALRRRDHRGEGVGHHHGRPDPAPRRGDRRLRVDNGVVTLLTTTAKAGPIPEIRW